MSKTFRSIFEYAKNFGISSSELKRSLTETSKLMKISLPEIEKDLFLHILKVRDDCINQSKIKGMELKPYQKLATEHMLKNRGMIAAFQTGTGKTLLAVTVASCILRLAKLFRKEIKVLIITPTSLQENFKKEMRRYGSNPNDPRYTFLTTAKFGMEYKAGKIDCSETLFIVDEAHVFRTDFRNKFTYEGVRISEEEDMAADTRAELSVLCAAKAWKVLLLTATPIYNRVYDIINLVSMVKGIDYPLSEDPFYLMRNEPKIFQEQYSNTILFQDSNSEDYPEQVDILVKVIMTPKYLKRYERLEDDLRKGLIYNEEGDQVTNAFMVKLRTASNKLDICLKCDFAMKVIERGEKTIFFSEFRSSGTEVIINLLEEKGIKYYLITGEINMIRRQEIVNEFNSLPSSSGRDNERIKLLIITKAGSEGLDLKGVRNVIIFEQGWNVSGANQVIGRAVRYKSHSHLPEKERLVRVWHLLTVKPYGEKFDKLLMRINPLDRPFDKVLTLNKEYAKDFRFSKNLNKNEIARIFGVDVYMLLQAREKHQQNMELEGEFRKIQIK